MGNFDDLILDDGSEPLDKGKNDYFLVTVTGLKPGKTYPLEFRWNYDTKEKNTNWSSVVKVVTPSYAPDAVTNLNVSWANEIFTLSFTHDRSLGQNANVLQYKIKIVAADSTERVFYHAPKTGSTQVFTLEYSKIVEAFGIPLYEFSGSVIAIDKDGNESTAVTFPLTTATTSLPAPVITVASATGGYTVTYTTPSATTYPNYSHINVEEVESSAGSDPGAGYSIVFSGVANPVVLSRSGSAQRWVRARFISKLGLPGPYSTAYAVTPTPAVVVNTTAPAAPSGGSLSGGVDPDGTVGFNGYVNVSWNAVNDSNLRGYRIRFRKNGSSDPYSYVDSPGTGTTYRLGGLAIGITYEVGVASYNYINNTSNVNGTLTWTSLGTYMPDGTPFIGKNVTTTGYFEAFPGGGNTSNAFRFGYGVETGKRGLTFNSNNYWYIDSSASALFKLGGDTENYISWDGSSFIVQGDIRAKKGTFTGNVQIVSGSLYAGASPSGGARLAISSTGLTAYDAGGTPTTNIYGNANTGGVTFDTIAGTIGNWSITNSSITKTNGTGASARTITLNSSAGSISAIASNANYNVTIVAPANPSDIVLYAGSSSAASAPFRVTADGILFASGATISGTITANALDTTSLDIASNGAITTSSGNFGVTSGGVLSATGATISGTINATGGTFSGNITASGTISGGTISGATITGAIITTTGGNTYGAIRMNSTNDAFEFLSGSTVVGSMFTWNQSEILIQRQAAGSFASNTGYISVNSTGLTLGKATVGQILDKGFIIDGNGISTFVGTSGFAISGGPLYTGTATSTVTDAFPGASLSQGGTLNLRRENNQPLNLHVFSVTAGATTSVPVINFYRNSTFRGTLEIFGNTSAPVLVGSSDYRLKENIRNYTGGLNKILAAKVRVFNEIEDPLHSDIVGFVAHEFAEVFPDFVNGEKDAIDEDGNPVYQRLSYSNMIPYLVEAIQTLSKRLDALEG